MCESVCVRVWCKGVYVLVRARVVRTLVCVFVYGFMLAWERGAKEMCVASETCVAVQQTSTPPIGDFAL